METNVFPTTSTSSLATKTAGDMDEAYTQFGLNHQYEFHNETFTKETSMELIAEFTADLTNVPEGDVNYNDSISECREKKRIYMQSTMSPLLAAVNDITKRDAEMQLYLTQNLGKESPIKLTKTVLLENISSSSTTEYFDTAIDCNASECLIIADKPVVCRAKASLPTEYLEFGPVNALTKEPSVIAKIAIPKNTTFGPMEGEQLHVSDFDLDILIMQKPRYYPILMINDHERLDVTNKDFSNWMRYVRLADLNSEQNLVLLLENGMILFKTTRVVPPREELRVQYHRSYAEHYYPQLLPFTTICSLQKDNIVGSTNSDHERYFSNHINMQSCNEDKIPMNQIEIKKMLSCSSPDDSQLESPLENSILANGLTTRCKICFKLFMTFDSLQTHMTKQHNQEDGKMKIHEETTSQGFKGSKGKTNSSKAIVCKRKRISTYKCNLCSKHFTIKEKLQLHRTTHVSSSKPHLCTICKQQCATPTALTAHTQSHSKKNYICIYCNEEFKYGCDFKRHVAQHRVRGGGFFQCPHCQKHYAAYHLARKHVRLFHTDRKFSCAECDKKFQNNNNLERHKLIHAQTKTLFCSHSGCQYTCKRKDHLNAHMTRIHGTDCHRLKDRKIRVKKMQTEVDTASTMNKEKITATKANKEIIEKKNDKREYGIRTTKVITNDGSQYLKMGEPSNLIVSSSSNRRKQTPTKLKTVELNAETVTYVALSEMLTPFLTSELELHEEFEKSESLTVKGSNRKSNLKSLKRNESIPVNSNTNENQTNKKKLIIETIDNKQGLNDGNDLDTFKTSEYKYNRPLEAVNEDNIIRNETDLLYKFKCHLCTHAAGFKRRGVLVNHFTKVHPEMKLNEIEILNMPIIKPQLVFPCPNCKNTYKSNAKRKAHIIKHHPGQDWRIINSKAVGSVKGDIYNCQHCPRQYAARNRLVSHCRQKHAGKSQSAKSLPKPCVDEQATPLLVPEIDIIPYQSSENTVVVDQPTMSILQTSTFSPENKLLKLSSAALELSRIDFLNERSLDDLNRLNALFEESSLMGHIDTTGFVDKYNHRSIELQFFEKIGKL